VGLKAEAAGCQALLEVHEHPKRQAPDHEPLDPQAGELEDFALMLVVQRRAVPFRDQILEAQPMDAPHLPARLELGRPMEPEDERGDREVQTPHPRDRLDLVESPEPFGVPSQVQAQLLAGLPSRRGDQIGVLGLRAPSGKRRVPRPGISRVIGPPDEQQLQAALGLLQDEGDRCPLRHGLGHAGGWS
jgi:hypothetical protein